MSGHDKQVLDALRQAVGEDRFLAAQGAKDLLSEGHLDSYAVLELTARLEDAYGIAISPTQIGGESYRTLDALQRLCRDLAKT